MSAADPERDGLWVAIMLVVALVVGALVGLGRWVASWW